VLSGLLLSACAAPTTGPTPDPNLVVRQAASWPAHAAPLAGEVALREQCAGAAVGPVVATDDRGFGVAFVLMGTPQNHGNCTMQWSGDSWVALDGGASQSSDPVPDDAFWIGVDGPGPAWTPEGASASPQVEWRELVGLAPVGTTEVRAAVGGRAVKATMGGRLFVLAWPTGTIASLVVALDAEGKVIARLDAAALTRPEPPSSSGP
jgi:hypothetical protein